jgi:ribosome-binding protein aMBF1 (putative translation factor)
MKKLDPQKLAKLPTYNQLLDEQYGKLGSDERNLFDEESLAWFYGNMLRERRKELKLTQKQVAEKIGKEQSYIARVESGKTDIQLSSFFRIAAILGIQFVPTFIQAMR